MLYNLPVNPIFKEYLRLFYCLNDLIFVVIISVICEAISTPLDAV